MEGDQCTGHRAIVAYCAALGAFGVGPLVGVRPVRDEGSGPIRWWAAAVTATMVLTALLGAEPPADAVGGRPGVTKTEIRVGGVASPSGAHGHVATAFDGVQAYFDLVNTSGGVFGRRLKLVARIDDRSLPSANYAANRTLVERRKVFAVIPEASRAFAGARYLAQVATPVFGWNVGLEWARSANLFGDTGSYTCFSCPAVAPAYVAKQLGVAKVGVLAPATPEATSCGIGLLDGFSKYGLDVAVEDANLTTDLSGLDADVQQVKDQGVQLIATCMLSVDAVAKIAGALQRAGLSAVRLYAREAYDPRALARSAKTLEGVIAGIGFVPWEAASTSKGTSAFLAAMKRRRLQPTDEAQAGWINAQLLTDGIKQAGKGFTQQSVIDAINAMTAFTADGILPGINWADGGHGPAREVCTAFVEAKNGRFVSQFGQPGQPFVCFPDNPLPPALDAPTFQPASRGAAGSSP